MPASTPFPGCPKTQPLPGVDLSQLCGGRALQLGCCSLGPGTSPWVLLGAGKALGAGKCCLRCHHCKRLCLWGGRLVGTCFPFCGDQGEWV